MSQFQVFRSDLSRTRLVDPGDQDIAPGEGEIRLRVERFGLSTNNITYGVAGETLGYWTFFPPAGDEPDNWGVLPVWGFAKVEESAVDELPAGERLFGYFPPATRLTMMPKDIAATHFLDGSPHRRALAKGYNIYRRVGAEPGYDRADDDLRMLLYPLYITSFSLWDLLKEMDWYGARQIIVVSASSKTSLGLAYALSGDRDAPPTVALTSTQNIGFVRDLGLYDQCIAYDDIEARTDNAPTVIVDMAGNAEILARLHQHLGNAMVKTLSVGLTHKDGPRRHDGVNRERTEFFFAPAQIQKRIEDWGSDEFGTRSGGFIKDTAARSLRWLELETINGVEGLPAVYDQMLNGGTPPQKGFLVQV